jgi:hypothetical protein
MKGLAAELPDVLAETPHQHHTLGVRQLSPEREIVSVGLGGRRISPDGDTR